MALFDTLGFHWDRSAVPTSVPSRSIERACFRFHKMLPEFVWGVGVLDGNKRTLRFMMNGALMSHGIDAISVPAADREMARYGLAEAAIETGSTPVYRREHAHLGNPPGRERQP
ncbi:MAG: hypothetical protein EPN41_02600 [Candidimonas sp.]|nr:MAG: hypothetical protein EPN41_02600 [Candidimonas sp.]